MATPGSDLDVGSVRFAAGSLQASSQSAGRVAVYGTDGVLGGSNGLRLDGDTLQLSRIGAFTASGAINFDDQALTGLNIDSGSVSGVSISASDVTIGPGRTLDVSAGSFTLADDQISGDTVSGGTLGGALGSGRLCRIRSLSVRRFKGATHCALPAPTSTSTRRCCPLVTHSPT